ncbi:hypothetical protein [Fluoribacter dumoffii]|uniref:Uncharacterized protein n=1 Tax=Fluoribacter dumoffii TaxID=463 RepID=A0A377G7C4_9GAMM|nr:acetyoacetyl CoA reductase [Fluoribacter dumoffii NY 23]STO20643.1 Uncharacterised protein [Fluoribacter dumoffii]
MERKVAVVTGGIGSAICRRLDKADYQVIPCYFKNGNLSKQRNGRHSNSSPVRF